MKKLLAAAAAMVAVVAAAPGAASAQADAEIVLLHGIPGVTVDVAVDGAVVLPGFEPGATQDISAFAGETLTNLEVRVAGTEDVAIGPVEEFPVPASGSYSVVAHLDADGNPTITAFENDTSAVAEDTGRLTARHTAAAPAIDIVAGDARPVEGAANGDESSLDLPAGEVSGLQIAPAGGEPIADIPTVDLAAGTNLIVYAVGSLDDGSFTFYTEERALEVEVSATEADAEEADAEAADAEAADAESGGDGTPAPTAVNTGDELSSSNNSVALFAAAAGLLVLGGGAVALRRRTAER